MHLTLDNFTLSLVNDRHYPRPFITSARHHQRLLLPAPVISGTRFIVRVITSARYYHQQQLPAPVVASTCYYQHSLLASPVLSYALLPVLDIIINSNYQRLLLPAPVIISTCYFQHPLLAAPVIKRTPSWKCCFIALWRCHLKPAGSPSTQRLSEYFGIQYAVDKAVGGKVQSLQQTGLRRRIFNGNRCASR
jgi:hypothetical protein